MSKQRKNIEELFNEVRMASAKVIVAMNELTARGRNKSGQVNKQTLQNAMEAHHEWRRAVDFYMARQKNDGES